MRNLRNIKHAAIKFNQDDGPVTATAWDSTELICSFGPSASSPTITLKRLPSHAYSFEQAITIASWAAPSPSPDLDYDKVLSLHCSPDSGTVCLILEGGDIITVCADTQPGEELIEIVGSVDAGISAAAWSPDEELLLIATKADTLLFMTREFEGTATVTLTPGDLQASNHVSVGWGKKETQFHGRGAKALRDPTVPEHVDEGKLSELDDLRTSISWRGDGQFVAINSILEAEPSRRVIRVYSREGVLDSVSEPVDGLEGALSWKPSGQLLAGVQRQEDRIDVVFFERNGLRHGEFSLRLNADQRITSGAAINLDWNNDSSVLAVSMKDRLQLWTMGNYHYYLKQEILLEAEAPIPASINWHSERPLQLACSAGNHLRTLDLIFEVTHGSVVSPHDQGIVAVIDGRRLKITPLRTANVPPPMAFEEIELPDNAIDVAVNQQGTKIIILHTDCISVWKCDYDSKSTTKSEMIDLVRVNHDEDGYSIARQIVLNGTGQLTTAKAGENQPGTKLTSFNDAAACLTEDNSAIPVLFQCINHDRIFFETSTGAVYEFGGVEPARQVGKLHTMCPSVEVWGEDNFEIIFGLSAGGTLHLSTPLQRIKIPSTTSFTVTSTHLIYTTSQHLLKFVHLHAGELEIPPDEPEKDERCRSIERGAKLVTVMPSAYSLVLQMPRGNLETIYPRALVLAGVRNAINERNYKRAFLICRTHRVDMNILHDYAPGRFMSDVSLFIKQVKKVEYIDLFLSSLSEENVSQTIYKDTIKPITDDSGLGSLINGDSAPEHASHISKVNAICDAFLQALVGHQMTHLQSIVTAHVCKNPPGLEAGLSLVAKLRKQEKQDQLEQAVEHICFLADVNQLYETALGIYDLDVALLVAQQSQKDPREYLPYLQSLHDMPSLRQRHAIDNDLKRYSKALSHLHELGEFDEIKVYAAKYDLYSLAIELYRYDNSRLTELMRIYADFLGSRNRYKEAGIAYEYVEDFASAYESYRGSGMWRECLACAALTGLSDEEMSELAQDLANSLEESKDYASAATIYLDHLQDLESSVRMLCRAYQFAEAVRQIALRRKSELLKSLVDPGLIEASATMTEMLAEMKTQLQAQLPRLRELRQKKAEDPMAFLDGGGEYDDVPDNISLAPTDTTTGGTLMTRYTNRSTGTLATNATRKTSKNRRREERKRARGKKGTVYEEEYLVNSITRLIERLNSSGDDVARLVEGLMRRTMRERAVAVETAFQEIFDFCSNCMEEVFSPPVAAGPQQENDEGGSRPWGGQGVLWEALAASQQKREVPVLKAFEKLGLLEK